MTVEVNMRVIVYATIAMVFYAIANVSLDVKLSRYNNLTLTFCLSFVVCVVSFAVMQFAKSADPVQYALPTKWALVTVIAVGLAYTVADYFFLGAYTSGGKLIVITSITSMMPIVASLMKYGLTREVPNPWHLAGYLMAVLALCLIAKGSRA